MKTDRIVRIVAPAAVLTGLAVVLVVIGMLVAGPAAASATPAPAPTDVNVELRSDALVRFGEDVLVPAGASVPAAVAFGGDIVVEGEVRDAVVAFGGDITVNGRVGAEVVAFGGNVALGPAAVIGSDPASTDASVVLFGGRLTRAPGAQVHGQVETVEGLDWGKGAGWAARLLIVNPMWGLSFAGWVVQTAFFLVLALVAAALMPSQMRAVQAHLGRRPWPSLGWGALAFFIVVPAILVVLVISIVGLLLLIPYVLFVTLAYFFVTTAVGAFVAQRVLTGGGRKDNLMLAVTLGVVGTTIVSRIPVAGPILVTAMMVIGTGAAVLAVVDWRRQRRAVAAGAATVAAGAPQAYPAAAPAAPANAAAVVQAAPATTAATQVTPDAAAATPRPGAETQADVPPGAQDVAEAAGSPGTPAEAAEKESAVTGAPGDLRSPDGPESPDEPESPEGSAPLQRPEPPEEPEKPSGAGV